MISPAPCWERHRRVVRTTMTAKPGSGGHAANRRLAAVHCRCFYIACRAAVKAGLRLGQASGSCWRLHFALSSVISFPDILTVSSVLSTRRLATPRRDRNCLESPVLDRPPTDGMQRPITAPRAPIARRPRSRSAEPLAVAPRLLVNVGPGLRRLAPLARWMTAWMRLRRRTRET
jgi:hypothetical protein